ncbi:kinesin-like protein KIN-5B [Salvia hispanica]|uniref:kinesin-like protein KIN-5B n=1 Tax=Salvia hispanica TaxID=49212 RepID=UPI002008FD36|nr:kinesin-like protein KIN-5B [Salvia hispanica]
MKQDSRAAREKNGVFIPHERFLQDEAEKAKNERIEQLESDLNESEKLCRKLINSVSFISLNIKSELKDCKRNLETTHKLLEDLKEKYKMALSTLKVTYALKTKASSDLEELTSVMPAQTIVVENFFQTATLESKEVLSDIQKSLTEQRRMLAFSAQQHTEMHYRLMG